MRVTEFSVQDASLKVLRLGEQGVITRIHPLRDAAAQSLKKMGLTPGQRITLEQRFPRFVVRVGNNRYNLNDAMMNAIQVRISQR